MSFLNGGGGPSTGGSRSGRLRHPKRSRALSVRTTTRLCALAACALAAAGAGAFAEPPRPQCPGAAGAELVRASDIPVAHTPAGGYGDRFPDPVLARCTEPLAPGAPDLRGLWHAVHAEQADDAEASRPASVLRFLFWSAFGVERERKPLPADHPIYAYVERIEQCGDRIVDIGGGTIADARADGTEENGVHDVSAFDFATEIHAVARYEDGAFVLSPPWLPIEVTRRLDADGRLVWHRPDLGDRLITLERIGGPCDRPPGTAWAR